MWLFDYDADQRLATVTFPPDPNTPVTLTFGYDADGRITSITDGAGQTWTYQYDADTGMLTTVTDPPDGSGNAVVQTLDYSTTMVNNRWETYYTDRSGSSWTYKFSRKGRLRERLGPDGFIESKMTYDSDGNLTSFDDGAGTVVTLTWGPVSTLLTLHTPTGGPDSSPVPVWNDVTFTWSQPDVGNRPNFWRLEQITDAEGYSTQYLYEDPDDDTRVTTIVDTPPDPNDPNTPVQVWDGRISPIPPTGIGHDWRRYWEHPDPALAATQGVIRRLERPAPALGLAEDLPVYAWRWRFFWVVPFVGGHIGIDYHRDAASNVLRYLDYGQNPDVPDQCPGCIPGIVFVNNRYPRDPNYDGILSRNCDDCIPQPTTWRAGSQCLRDCLDGYPADFGVPRNWSDPDMECVRYFFTGWTPSWPLCQWLGLDCGGDYSNSNGGAHAALHHCMGSGGRCPAIGRRHPPYCWTRYWGWGWNNRDRTFLGDVCSGYDPDLD